MTPKNPKTAREDPLQKVAWIRTVAETDALGYVKNIYETFRKQRGWVPNILKATTIRPDVTRGWETFFNTLMYGPSGLKRAQREMIAVVVSAVNHCYY
ncbi:carboxymuconolactone decarboxylase family protein [Acidobacteria bacterium AH-259-D05]|nr:carboxymuconolactone decarboxylase family protein [Acidobacteria bacterium AH-259-D05]